MGISRFSPCDCYVDLDCCLLKPLFYMDEVLWGLLLPILTTSPTFTLHGGFGVGYLDLGQMYYLTSLLSSESKLQYLQHRDLILSSFTVTSGPLLLLQR